MGVACGSRVPYNEAMLFQYPRRIECGCGPSSFCARLAPRGAFSILGGSSVGVAISEEFPPLLRERFQYPRRIECGCGTMY